MRCDDHLDVAHPADVEQVVPELLLPAYVERDLRFVDDDTILIRENAVIEIGQADLGVSVHLAKLFRRDNIRRFHLVLHRLRNGGLSVRDTVDHPGIVIDVTFLLVAVRWHHSLGSRLVRTLVDLSMFLEFSDFIHELLLPLVESFFDGENILFHSIVIPLFQHGKNLQIVRISRPDFPGNSILAPVLTAVKQFQFA